MENVALPAAVVTAEALANTVGVPETAYTVFPETTFPAASLTIAVTAL